MFFNVDIAKNIIKVNESRDSTSIFTIRHRKHTQRAFVSFDGNFLSVHFNIPHHCPLHSHHQQSQSLGSHMQACTYQCI